MARMDRLAQNLSLRSACRPGVLLTLAAGSLFWVAAPTGASAQKPAVVDPNEAAGPAPAEAPVPQDARRTEVTDLPQNFERWQDSKGYSWQLTRQGFLLSGGVPYFQAAMQLKLGSNKFEAQRAFRLDGGEADAEGARIELRGSVGQVSVTRDVWLDSGRSGVRYLDVFENPDEQPFQIEVSYTTSYQNPWQDLHAGDGRVLGAGKEHGLDRRDYGVAVKFSQAEGRHDTLLLVTDEDREQKPEISFSDNHRELTLSYQLEIPAGGQVALVHWILQRGMTSAREADQLLRPFYLRRRLIDPAVPKDLAQRVENFSIRAADAAPDAENLAALVTLNRLLNAFEIQRTTDDVLWISASNQLAGEVSDAVKLVVATRYGERQTTLAGVAAIQGGGGFGRTPRVFLRDGRVWAGAVKADGLGLKSPDGVAMNNLNVAEFELLLLHLGGDDGLPPEIPGGGDAAPVFVALRSGDVMAVAADEENRIELLSPWGTDRASFGEIESLRYANFNAPRYRLRTRDGSRLTVFLADGKGPFFEATSVAKPGADGAPDKAGADASEDKPAAADATVDKPAAADAAVGAVPSVVDIVGLWHADSVATASGLDEFWLEVEDVAPVDDLNLPMCLLQGNNLLHAELESEALHLVSGTSVTRLVPAEIVAVRRSDETDDEADPIFEIELRGGDRLVGRLREKAIALRSSTRLWNVPVQHFNSYLGERAE